MSMSTRTRLFSVQRQALAVHRSSIGVTVRVAMRRWPCRSPCPAWGLALFVSAACVEGPAKAPPLAQATQGTTLASAPARSSKHVLVTIVVDQLAGWIADERWPELPKDGGFARLRREG